MCNATSGQTKLICKKVAVMSDIHSNYHGLRACYEDAVNCGANGFVFLGDYVSDLAEPEQTMDLIYEIQGKYPTVCLRGNREGYLLNCKNGKEVFEKGSKTGSLLFTYTHLRENDFEFFRTKRISDTIEINGVTFEIAHATLDNDRYYFDSNDGNIARVFPQMRFNYLLTGHSHKQYIEHNADKTIINPGSVGIPQGGSRNPKYAFLEINGGEVPYDITEAIHSQFARGLVDIAKYWATGILYDIITGEECVLKLLKYVKEKNGIYDEKVWQTAAESLGMKFTEREILEYCRNYDLNNQNHRKESAT